MTMLTQSFARSLDELRVRMANEWTTVDPKSAFAYFVNRSNAATRFRVELPEPTWPASDILKHPQSIAAFGFYLAANENFSVELRPTWIASLRTLLTRDAFPLDRQSFAFRPFEVWGLAVGCARCLQENSEERKQLTRTVEQCCSGGNSDMMSLAVYSMALQCLRANTKISVETTIEKWDNKYASLFLHLCSIEAIGNELKNRFHQQAEKLILESVAFELVNANDIAEAAILHRGLSIAVSSRLQSELEATGLVSSGGRDAISLIVTLCRRFPFFARQLQERRKDVIGSNKKEKFARPTVEMKDEYDVQDSFFALLKLFFDNVDPEVWAPSYAGSQSRMDFVLPEEKIVIEAKYVGLKLKQSNIVEQLIIDKDRYRKHESCKTLICLVYDPLLRCTNAAALEADVSEQSEDFTVITIVCPRGS